MESAVPRVTPPGPPDSAPVQGKSTSECQVSDPSKSASTIISLSIGLSEPTTKEESSSICSNLSTPPCLSWKEHPPKLSIPSSQLEQPVPKPPLPLTPPATPVATGRAEYFSAPNSSFVDIIRCTGKGNFLSIAANIAVLNQGSLPRVRDETTRKEDSMLSSSRDLDKGVGIKGLEGTYTIANGADSVDGGPTVLGNPRSKRTRTTYDGQIKEKPGRIIFDIEESSEDCNSDEDSDWVGKGAGFWEHLLYKPAQVEE